MFIFNLLLHDAKSNRKIMVTITMSGETHPESQYQLLEKFHVYMYAKSKLH